MGREPTWIALIPVYLCHGCGVLRGRHSNVEGMLSTVTQKHIHCRMDTSLTDAEKRIFSGHLGHQNLSVNVWDLFGQWVERSTPSVHFFYLKAYRDGALAGLALFLKIKPFDLRSSYSGLRNSALLNKLGGVLSALTRNCVYVSFRNLITCNLTRPFFFREPEEEELIMQAFLRFLKDDKEADMVTIVDTAAHDPLYTDAGFRRFDSSSEAYLDVGKYSNVSEYLGQHRSLRKNLRRRKNIVTTSVRPGPVSSQEISALRECVACSVEHTRVNNPCQRFFEENLFSTEVFNTDKYLHILVYVGDKIAGFHTFLVSGSHLGGVVGGFNRQYSQNHFAYERVIVTSLDYAIENNISRVHYSLVDNLTKLRLVESLEPCGLYFFSRSALNRKVFERTYRYSDVFELSLLERTGKPKDPTAVPPQP